MAFTTPFPPITDRAALFLLLVTLSVLPAMAHAQDGKAPYIGESLDGRACSSFDGTEQGYGPYDYRKYSSSDPTLKRVEDFHFTNQVQTLAGGENSQTPIGDLHYTLMAFPNHHKALYAMIRLHTGEDGEEWTSHAQFSASPPPECFLQRAAAFTPEDPEIRLLYGIYLHRLEKSETAVDKYREALDIQEEFPEAWYNLGLAYLDLEKYEKAREAARRAYEEGYPLPGLREKLAEAGYSL